MKQLKGDFQVFLSNENQQFDEKYWRLDTSRVTEWERG